MCVYRPVATLPCRRPAPAFPSAAPSRADHLTPPHPTRSGFDNNRVYSVSVLPGADRERDLSKAQAHLFEFLQTFRVGGEFKYRCVTLRSKLCCGRSSRHGSCHRRSRMLWS